MTFPNHLSGPRHLDSFIVTPNPHPSIVTMQKHMPTLTRTATNQTAGPLGCNYAFRSHLPACPDKFAAQPGQID